MEQTFAQLSQQFLEKAERQYGAPFEIQKNVTCCGIEFPMTAGYIKRDGRHFLGIQSNFVAGWHVRRDLLFFVQGDADTGRLAGTVCNFSNHT